MWLLFIKVILLINLKTMPKTSQRISSQLTVAFKKNAPVIAGDNLTHLAFDNVAQANVIIIVSSGKIIMANSACSKLLGYSKKELLTKNRTDIFDIKESSFKKMMKQRTAEGRSKALVFAIKKNGKPLPCEITSAVFIGEHGIEKSITTITDISQRLQEQQKIDTGKAKVVADNIVLAESKQKQIDIEKEKIVENNISLVKAKQKKIDSNKEKKVAHNITVAKSKQKEVDSKNKKIVDNDIIVAKAKSDARLAENNEWIKYIAKSSYDVMWDWDIISGEVYVGDSVAEVFGYKLYNNTMRYKEFCHCLFSEEKVLVEDRLAKVIASGSKTWNDSFMFKRKDGSAASTVCRASIVRDEDGKAIRLIGAIQDISRLDELEQKLADQVTIQEEQGEKFLLAAKLSFDVIWDWNIETNEVFLGDGFEELFGYAIENNKADMIADWVNYLHPDDKEAVILELQNAIRSTITHWEHAYRVNRADGTIAKVYVRACIKRHKDGKAYRMIGAMQDLSWQKEMEEKVDHEIKLKEKQITDATEDAKEMERSNIGKELHDNINQLLGASRLFLEMAKKGGINTPMYLSRSSEYTLSAIEEIRKLSKGLTTDIIKNLGLCAAIENIADDLMEVSDIKITCVLNAFHEKGLDNKFKLNIFRIVQEHLNNILKHAQATTINVRLSQNKKAMALIITDNGIADFASSPGKGCKLTVHFFTPVKQ